MCLTRKAEPRSYHLAARPGYSEVFVKMWIKKLLRTKHKRTTIDCNHVSPLKAVSVLLFSVLCVLGGPGRVGVEARAATAIENNELESATAMIEFRNSLNRILLHGDSSLTLLTLPTNNNKDPIEQSVRGLRFHAVSHPVLCDDDLKSRLNVQIVVSQDVNPVHDDKVNDKFVCAVWPVELSTDGNSARNQLEWLSANGIERRSQGAGADDADDLKDTRAPLQYLVMHLGDDKR